MDGSSFGNGNPSFPLSSKSKFVGLLTLIIVVIEIYSVQQWESASAIITPAFKTERNSKEKTVRVDLHVEMPPEPDNAPVNQIDESQIKKEEKSAIPVEEKSNQYTYTAKTVQVHPHVEKPPEPDNAPVNQLDESQTKKEEKSAIGLPVEEKSNQYTYAVRKYLELEDELKKHLEKAIDKKLILVWVPMFGVKNPISIDQKKCGNCEVTYDRSKVSDERTGAVLFHFDRINKNDMPKPRNPKQLHIYWAIESSATLKVVRGHSLQFENSYPFNDTMTYRRDSGFYNSYSSQYYIDLIKKENTTPEELLKQKEKLAVAVVSNCGYTPGARTRMRKLKEIRSLGFALDGYGGCFPGGRKFANGKSRGTQEFHDAVRKYKFYFSFENSFHCKDYITEKFFNNAIASLAVPVVWGAEKENYEAVAPPGSFIYADDFSSMKELADYLKYLDSNDTAYMEYLRWVTMKPEYMPQYGRVISHCHICRALHGINIDDIYSPKFNESKLLRPLFSDGIAPRRMDHLIDWIYGEDSKECFNR